MLHGIIGMVMLVVEKVVVGKGGGFYLLFSIVLQKEKNLFFFLVAFYGSFQSGSYIPGKKLWVDNSQL